MAYKAGSIANYFLNKAKETGREKSMDPLKVLKLIYYAHGWHAGLTGEKLIVEPVEAWMHGPVVSDIYDEFKKFGRQPITSPATYYDPDTGSYDKYDLPVDEDTLSILERVWEVYGGMSGIKLSNISHEDGGPWQKAIEKVGYAGRGVVIDFDLIHAHFKELAEG